MAVASFSHRLEYPDNHGITLTDIAELLLAHERAVKLIPIVLERSVSGLNVERIEITLVEAQEGSLVTEFAVKIFSEYQAQIESRVVRVVEALTGTLVAEQDKTLVTLLIILLFLMGATWVWKKFNPSNEGGGLHIRGDYNKVLNVTAETLSISPEALDDIVWDATKGPTRKVIGKASQRFFKPAQRNGIGRISVKEFGEISKATVEEMPTDVDIEVFDEAPDMLPLPKETVQLRAYDLDRRGHGWFGRINLDGEDVRLPLSLYPTLDIEALKGVTEITADIIVEQQRDDSGDWKPTRIHVVKIHSTKAGPDEEPH